jgi:hypothetical protein
MRRKILGAAFSVSFLFAPAVADNASPDVAATDPDQKIKCRKVEVTGSLLKKGKVCRTAAEWRRIVESGNRTARAVVEEGAKPTN